MVLVRAGVLRVLDRSRLASNPRAARYLIAREPWPTRYFLLALIFATLGISAVLATEASASSDGSLTSSSMSTYAPLEASMTTAAGSWADLAMGDLGHLANTFWQLLFLPAGRSRWSLVTPPGFADNGGLVSVQVGSNLVSGFEASQRIAFSPIASSSNGGKSWAPGILSSELAGVPDALAGTPNGRAAALIGNPAAAVVADRGGLYNWHQIVSARDLKASMAARLCEVTQLTAVAFSPSGQLLIAASCSCPGKVGVFEDSPSGWHLAGPSLPSYSSATTSVLRLRAYDGGVSALIATYSGARTELLGTRLGDNGGWSSPIGLVLGRTERLTSSGISVNGGLVVTVGGAERPFGEALGPGSRSWTRLPPSARRNKSDLLRADSSDRCSGRRSKPADCLPPRNQDK